MLLQLPKKLKLNFNFYSIPLIVRNLPFQFMLKFCNISVFSRSSPKGIYFQMSAYNSSLRSWRNLKKIFERVEFLQVLKIQSFQSLSEFLVFFKTTINCTVVYIFDRKKQGIQLSLFVWKNDKDKATSKSWCTELINTWITITSAMCERYFSRKINWKLSHVTGILHNHFSKEVFVLVKV